MFASSGSITSKFLADALFARLINYLNKLPKEI